MPSFQSGGREWSLQFDGLLLSELRQRHGINLADVSGGDYLRLERDFGTLTVAVSFLLRSQLKEAGLTEAQFARGFVGESLDAALAAVWEAARLFFPPRRWSELVFASNHLRSQWKELGPAMAMLNQPDVPETIREAVTAALLAGLNSASEPSGANPSASGPEATPSTPASPAPDSAESGPTD